MRGKSTGTDTVVLKDTRPTRLPVPTRTSRAKSDAASRASAIFELPVPASMDMLPERSNTSMTSRVSAGVCGFARSWFTETMGK